MMVNAVKHLEMFRDDKPSQSGPLPYPGIPLREKAQGLASGNNRLTELARCARIAGSDGSDHMFEVLDESLPEDYFEIHALNRERTSVPE
jgi:hypothetical protein